MDEVTQSCILLREKEALKPAVICLYERKSSISFRIEQKMHKIRGINNNF